MALVTVDSSLLHDHKEYTVILRANTKQIMLPPGEKFILTQNVGAEAVETNTVQVYVNGILNTNGLNFIELVDIEDQTKGNGVLFDVELHIDDVITIEWIVRN